jgi:uncharacterized membrane protein
VATLSETTCTEAVSLTLPNRRAYRLDAIDLLRGLVIVIMAIDHVRDFFLLGAQQDPMSNPSVTAGLFATRWITHFCAPVFVLLAGVSAGLMSARKRPGELARFLLTRGVWLVFVEIFVIATLTTFSPVGIAAIGGLVFVSMQVIWAIGASMVVLAGLQRLGRRACLAIGIAIAALHNLLDPIWPASKLADQQWPAWVALHSQMSLHVGPFLLRFAYPLLPWIGVMALGFGISRVFEQTPARRDSILFRSGVVLTAGFLLIRAIGIYGDPNSWKVQPAGVAASVMSFLNTTKYPPSLDYLLMTLGPAAILCSLADGMSGALKDILVMFGRVPFAFYVAHFFLIHLFSVLFGVIQGFAVRQMMTNFRFYPKTYGVSLPAVYAVWALVILLLYPYCRWVASVKARRRDWWLSYVEPPVRYATSWKISRRRSPRHSAPVIYSECTMRSSE